MSVKASRWWCLSIWSERTSPQPNPNYIKYCQKSFTYIKKHIWHMKHSSRLVVDDFMWSSSCNRSLKSRLLSKPLHSKYLSDTTAHREYKRDRWMNLLRDRKEIWIVDESRSEMWKTKKQHNQMEQWEHDQKKWGNEKQLSWINIEESCHEKEEMSTEPRMNEWTT